MDQYGIQSIDTMLWILSLETSQDSALTFALAFDNYETKKFGKLCQATSIHEYLNGHLIGFPLAISSTVAHSTTLTRVSPFYRLLCFSAKSSESKSIIIG